MSSHIVVIKKKKERGEEEQPPYVHQKQYITAEMWTAYQLFNLTQNEQKIITVLQEKQLKQVNRQKLLYYLRVQEILNERLAKEAFTSLRQKGLIDYHDQDIVTRKKFSYCDTSLSGQISFAEFIFLLDEGEEEVSTRDYPKEFLANLKRKKLIRKSIYEFNTQYYILSEKAEKIRQRIMKTLSYLQRRVRDSDSVIPRSLSKILTSQGLVIFYTINCIFTTTSYDLQQISDYLCMNHCDLTVMIQDLVEVREKKLLTPNFNRVRYYLSLLKEGV